MRGCWAWWQEAITRLRKGWKAAEAEASPIADDELGRLIRWSFRSTVGREEPRAAVWWRIRDEILAPSGRLCRRRLRSLVGTMDLSRMVQGAVTIVLLLFMFTSVLGQPLSPWSTQLSRVTPRPRQLVEMRSTYGVPEDLMRAADSFKPQETGDHRGQGRAAGHAGDPEAVRLSRVRDVAAAGFVPVIGRSRRALTDPAEDVLISQVSRHFLAEIHARGEDSTDDAFAEEVAGFRFGVIPVAYQLD